MYGYWMNYWGEKSVCECDGINGIIQMHTNRLDESLEPLYVDCAIFPDNSTASYWDTDATADPISSRM